MDFPLPKDGRLVVRENETRLTDVVFRFHPAKVRTYELHFRVKEGIFYAEPHVLTYGNSGVGDKWINDVYLERVVARGGVNAWIKMRRGAARIYIRYTSPLPEE